jgi:MoaA/NifB/PqqE/SkfB family radical SAM enzyme
MVVLTLEKMLSLSGTMLKSNVGSLRLPYKINFSITYLCQSRCLTCNIWQIKPKGELSIEEIREFARKNNYFKWVELTGGEPFLRGDIVEIARTFKDNCKDLYILTFPTNSLCDPKMLHKKISDILALGIPRIAITLSLDGNKELHDRIRGVPGNYERAIANYKMLQELAKTYKNVYFVFGYTMSKFNAGQFQRVFEDVKRDIPTLKVNDFHINLAQTSENYYKNENDDIRPSKELALSDLKWIMKNREFRMDPISLVEDSYMRRLVRFLERGNSPMRSRGLDASLFMDSFGNVYPSIMWDRKIGNIRDSSFDLRPIWKGELAEKARKDIKNGLEPNFWTSCEAYQTITGNMLSLIT